MAWYKLNEKSQPIERQDGDCYNNPYPVDVRAAYSEDDLTLVIGEEIPEGIPNEMQMIDQGTGLPVKVIVKNGKAYVGGLDDEAPA